MNRRDPTGLSPGSMDPRNRFSDDVIKRRSQRNLNDCERINTCGPDQSSCCKNRSLKLVLSLITCGTLLMFLYSPAMHDEHLIFSGSRSRFIGADGWTWESVTLDPRYKSHSPVDWKQILRIVKKINDRTANLNVGFLNFDVSEVDYWKRMLPIAESSTVHLEYAQRNLTWDELYPEWIDEEEEFKVPACPILPEPKVPKGSQFNLVAVKLPCNQSGDWSRDVARFHLQLSAARLSPVSGTGHHGEFYVMFVTGCFLHPNLFVCKDLVARQGDVWLYKPELGKLREKLRLPVGSCELALPLKAKVRPRSETEHREAYATILHSVHIYVCGAIAAAQSIRFTGSTRDLVILVDESISDHHRSGLEAAGWKVRTIERIRNPKAERDAYNEWNYSKFRLWLLTDYDKIVFIDADLLVLRNIDFLFSMPEITATGNNGTLFNSGVMVVEPSECTFRLLMDHVLEIDSYNGGDQGYLNEIFTWWHRIPKWMNFLKHFWAGDEADIKLKKTRLFGADPPELYVLHYLGMKPWLCFRDYDCNWNVEILREFASDAAHERWWRVHDAMPEGLRGFCLLQSKQKAALEWDRRQAKRGRFEDGHWRRKIKDPRLGICFEDFCFWKSMLWHWGETNSTTEGTPSAAANTTTTTTAALPSL